jgi:hypothetical protein
MRALVNLERLAVAASLALGALALGGCATVAPEQRAVLADPTMQFDNDGKHEAPLHHALENREGAMGGTGVQGGGCGCN